MALRLVDAGALLVADDQVLLTADTPSAPTAVLIATAPERLAGLLEVRGVGILPVPFAPSAPLRLVVDLMDRDAVARLPDPAAVSLADVMVPRVALWPFAASAPATVRLVLATLAAGLPLVPPTWEEVAA
ncbi:serine kinase of HPr protein (carbohydrate metabolism regulator) [Nitrospirillum iridis]|uniref:Serine kinase of HPr protein (Carbohydrate metabolism regulator) n=1 Tax=Nitrospirillum iridis TaxID=765888 RepID=A0A7X0EE74_9PROT|nr:serine kinase of HPr protein (carbohydrate metabolism regulator) [Nitrospirillum iridis]